MSITMDSRTDGKSDIARATLRNASYSMKVHWPLKIISVDRDRNSWHERTHMKVD